MHPQIKQKEPGYCRKCGMALINNEGNGNNTKPTKSFWQTYHKLFIIIGLILISVITSAFTLNLNLNRSLQLFMAGFFLTFSGFKLIDLSGFQQGYSTYDLIAKRFPFYGYLYPFIELVLGLLFLTNSVTPSILIFTIILMLISGFGVANSLKSKTKFHCACLGTAIDLPLGTVTLIEDFGMAFMALYMLLT